MGMVQLAGKKAGWVVVSYDTDYCHHCGSSIMRKEVCV
nr:MAG TPA_asm: PROTEIN/RNA Complex, archaeal, ribosomal, 50S, protein.0A [Caudoviricetes sp.]